MTAPSTRHRNSGGDPPTAKNDIRIDPEDCTEMAMDTETVEGYVIDGGCIRKNGREELLEEAREHTRECALMGHCIESGYGVVTEDDRLTMLDPEATPKVVDVVRESDTQEGIRLRVTRERDDGQMETTDVAEIE
ncbi:hypothetical protein DMJ13_24575 [halophilic archaeon]|nr:hypothetical protein DMJ13_24575 [halophilic archaeon]